VPPWCQNPVVLSPPSEHPRSNSLEKTAPRGFLGGLFGIQDLVSSRSSGFESPLRHHMTARQNADFSSSARGLCAFVARAQRKRDVTVGTYVTRGLTEMGCSPSTDLEVRRVARGSVADDQEAGAAHVRVVGERHVIAVVNLVGHLRPDEADQLGRVQHVVEVRLSLG
jgi:hypothetical protein